MAKQKDLLDDREAALIGHITLLKEEVLSQREALGVAGKQIADLQSRLRSLEEHIAQMERPGLLSINEAAKRLGLSERTLRRWRDEARPPIPFFSVEGIIRYDPKDIENYLQTRKRGAKTALKAG